VYVALLFVHSLALAHTGLPRFPYTTLFRSPPLIVCVARLVPFKRIGLLLEACAILRAWGVEFRCAIVGDGPCRDELETARARLGLAQAVELVGAAEQAEVLAWWRKAAAAVLPSDSEGMPV